MFKGERTLREIKCENMPLLNGELLRFDLFTKRVDRLDAALRLDSPRFRERMAATVRELACIRCYEAEPAGLRRQLEELFTGANGPGFPRNRRPDGQLRAALIPHIDYHRGGVTFAWGFKEVFERADASLFVIIGTSHYSNARYPLTRKDFKSPLGVARTDQQYIDRLVGYYGDGLFADEWAHLPEHSIELEVIFLQYFYADRRPFRIVPLVVGTFQDTVVKGVTPHVHEDIARMIEALRKTEEEPSQPICYIISGDLAHIGPKFGDPELVAAPFLKYSREQDQLIL